MLTKVYSDFLSAIKVVVIVKDDLDYCGGNNTISHFCKSYYVIVVEKKILKFGFANCINVSLYQKYLNVFNN